MNLLFALLVLTSPLRQPQYFYLNGKHLERLDHIDMPNSGHAAVNIYVYSPYELRSAWVDSSEAHVCLPDYSVRKQLRLDGRWYVITWDARFTVGSTEHRLSLYSYRGKPFRKDFYLNVEGSKRLEKPQGVN